ncbi:MAG: OmpA family protein [Crocinitomicaceae bacterium]|nr:PD40 domain-containing protein [Crocinitomicaceae bacterium]
MYKIIVLLMMFTAPFAGNNTAYSQEKPAQIKKYVKKGRKAYAKGEYWKAKSYYDKVTASSTTKPQYWLEAGMVYYESEVEREKSLALFDKALEYSADEGDTLPEIFYYKAKAHHFNGEFEKAIENYNIFLNNVKNNKKGIELRQEVIREIEICNNGVDLRNKEADRYTEITNMGPKVNTEYPEYAPVVTNTEDLLLFCSRRPPGRKQNMDGLYYEDIFYTKKSGDQWGLSDVIDKSSGYLDKEINEGKQHEAPISLSPDGKTLYIYKKNSIWKSELDDKGKWSIPMRMNQNVNIGEHNPSVFITEDGNEMFIVSKGAAGGMGGRDIYYTKMKEDGGWEKPVNLGGIVNTKFDEDAPFLSADGKTLYFASTGHNSMGGYDIFKTTRDDQGNWSEPINIGAPINSAGNDIYYVENAEGTLAYYASMRPGSFGYLDLYTANFECKNIPTTEVKGYAIFAENHLPVNGVIKVTNKETGEEAGTYQIDPKTGRYTMVLKPEATYYLELVVAQSRYNEIRPHREEFFIPKQCEYYNLFQEIAVDYLKDTTGSIYAQRAHFKNAMFDIDSEIKKKYGENMDLSSSGTNQEVITGISGHIAHNSTLNGQFIELILLNNKNQIVRMTQTDEFGNFAFEKLDTKQEYILVINEDDAKMSQLGNNMTSGKEIMVNGVVRFFEDKLNLANEGLKIYLANSGRDIVNATTSGPGGKFNMTNLPSDAGAIATLNSSTTMSYNLDLSDVEITYSAFITHIDPNNTELTYTEYVDIIELKEMTNDITQSGNGMQQFANLLFDFDKFFLREKSKNILESIYAYMKANPTVTIRLEGHTDWFGSEPYNVGLSKDRSLSAHKYLIDKGIAPNRIQNAWFGETKPTANNANPDGSDSEEGRQLNRRVEIKVEIPDMADLYLSL